MKIKVSRTLAEALDDVRETHNDERILNLHVQTKFDASKSWGTGWTPLNDLTALELSKILIYGYEIEETPHEKLKRLYDAPPQYVGEENVMLAMQLETAFRHGIKTALKMLDAQVKGIND